MLKRELKNIILIILITLSIWQTGKLWLGNMSSLSFFVQSEKSVMEQIEPQSIWLVPGAPGTLVYRLGEENREYHSVRDEIEKNISSYLQAGKIKEIVEIDWKKTFERQGILYEYPMPITYGEMIGSSTASQPKDKAEITEIDYVFMQLSNDATGHTNWQLISSAQNKLITVEVQGEFDNMKAFNDLLSKEALSYKVKYQPTFNLGSISNKNLFLPIASKDTPIAYDTLEWYNPLKNQTDLNKFNPYVNHYFFNPLLKKEEVTKNGIYIFSELMRAIVKYYPSGVFEYSNIAAAEGPKKISRLEAYNIGKRFLKTNESIDKEIKNTLFLANIEEVESGYIFYYDMRIKGIPVCFSQKERDRMGMDHMVQITVEGQEVSNFKWSIFELKPGTGKYTDGSKTDYFTVKYTDAINMVLEHVSSKEELQTLIIDDMKWVYMINGDEESVDVRWNLLHQSEWYTP